VDCEETGTVGDFRDIRREEMKVKIPALSLQKTEGPGRGTRWLAERVFQLPNQIRGGPARKFRHYLTAVEDVMAIDSRWTARRRDFRDIRREEMKVKSPPCPSKERRDQDGAPAVVVSRKCVPASKSDSRVGASFFFACFAGSEGQPRSNYGENLRRRAPLRVI